jgi:ribonuclease Z
MSEGSKRCSLGRKAVVVEIGNANRVLRAKLPIGKGKKVELIGRSWAADSTAFVVPSLNLALDAGYPVHGKRMNFVFVTHAHTDHIHHITHLKSRSKPPIIYLPNEAVSKAENFIDVAQQLTSNLSPEEYAETPWDTTHVMHGVRSGDRVVVDKKQGLICDVVHCDHTVPCVGYCFSNIKQSLKPEYRGLPGSEIGKLRKLGVQVTQEETQALFCFLGDTSTSILESDQAETIFSCPTVIIECSFLTTDCTENAGYGRS